MAFESPRSHNSIDKHPDRGRGGAHCLQDVYAAAVAGLDEEAVGALAFGASEVGACSL